MRRDVVLRKVKENKGFTLLETLVVVAIMTVLTAVSFLAVGDMKETVEMTELDDYAKSIYLEAQNRLSAIEVGGGMPQFYDELQAEYEDRFLADNAPVDYLEADEEWKNICYITRDEAIAVGLMPQNSYSSSMSGNYVLELNAQTGDVYGAFYWESEEDIDYANVIEALDSRRRSDRVDSELGYYGGTSMNTIALLENAPASSGGNGFGGKQGGMVYFEKYADGTYGVLVLGDDNKGTISINNGTAYEKLEKLNCGNTLREANRIDSDDIVECGFAAFTGDPEGYWRFYDDEYYATHDPINENGKWITGIQDWPLILNWGEPMENIMPDSIMRDEYTLKLVKKIEGGLEPTTLEYSWGGSSTNFIHGQLGYVPAVIDGVATNGHGHHVQYNELIYALNTFLWDRYNIINAV